MKKLFGLLVVFNLFVTMPAAAQFKIGIKGGVNLPDKPATNFEEIKNSVIGNTGWFVGPTAKLMIPIIGLGIEAELLYSQSNLEFEGQIVKSQNIDVPVNLRYDLSLPTVGRFVVPFVTIGPQFSWNVGNNHAEVQSFRDLVNGGGNTTADKILDYIPGVDKTFKVYKLEDRNISANLGFGLILFKYLQIHANYNITFDNTAEFLENNPQSLDSVSGILELTKDFFETKTNSWQISLAVIF